MLLRNSRVLVLLLVLLSTAIACRHQAVAAQVPSAPNQQQAQTSQTPSQQPQSKAAQSASPPSQEPQSQNQKTQGQPNQSQQDQPQPSTGQQTQDQGRSGDSGVFVIAKEVEEVVLHATAMDDKNNLVTTLYKVV